MDKPLKCYQAVEQYFTVVLFVFQLYPVGNFGLGTVRSERVNLARMYEETWDYLLPVPRRSGISQLILHTDGI